MPELSAFHPRRWLVLLAIASASVIAGCTCIGLLSAARASDPEALTVEGDPFGKAFLAARLEMNAGQPEAAIKRLEALRRRRDCPPQITATLVELYLQQRQEVKARALLNEGLKAHPDSVPLLALQAALLRKTGKVDQAIASLNRALALEPRRQALLEELSEAHLQKLRQVTAEQELEVEVGELTKIYERMLSLREGRDRLAPLLVLSSLYLRSDPARALPLAKEAVELDRHETRPYLSLGAAQEALKQPAEAMKTYREALAIDTDDEDVRERVEKLLGSSGASKVKFYAGLAQDAPKDKTLQQLYAKALVGEQRWAEADSVLRHIRELWPEDSQARLDQIRVWVAQDRLDQAIAEAGRARQGKDELAPLATLAIAEGLLARHNQPKAIEILATYHKDDPASENVTLALGSLLIETGQDAQAIQVLEDFCRRRPDIFMGSVLLAQAYSNQKRYDDAQRLLAALPEATRRNNEPELLRMQGDLYRRQKNYPKALEIFQSLLKKHADVGQYFLDAGTVCQEMGRNGEAEKYFRQALRIDPTDAEAYNTLGYFYAETNQKLDEALTLLTKAAQLKPDAGHIMDSLGWLLYRRGDFKGAQEKLLRAVKLMEKTPDPVVYEHLGDVCEKLGRLDEAREAWKKSLALDQESASVRQKLARLSDSKHAGN